MKKVNILILIVLVISSFFLSSYRTGAARNGWDCTGAETGLGNPLGCNSGGCHGSAHTAGITVVMELDSVDTMPVTKYKPGVTYTFKITGTNTTNSNLPKFGFQVSAIQGSVSQTTPVNAGTFQQTGLPAGVHYSAAVSNYYVTNIVEQSQLLSPASGTGGNGTVYAESFTWTAPVAGTGTVSFWGVINAVNGDGNASSADHWNTNQLILDEDTGTAVVVNSIKDINQNAAINVFPNPISNNAQITIENAVSGVYDLRVFDTEGRAISTQTIEVTGPAYKTSLNTTAWSSGIYFIELYKDGTQKVMKIMKQ